MGLFDGAADGTGSTADVAALLGLPVVLVVDAAGMGASAAALVEGFIRFREDIDVAAVVFNRVGSRLHADLLRRACDDRFSQPVLGCLPPATQLALPERHLGLVLAAEQAGLDATIERLADLVTAELDLERLLRLARPPSLASFGQAPLPLPPLGQRIAVARDAAFAFAYDAVLDSWRGTGAEVLLFAPLADDAPDPNADAVYLPGGYPELHAARLADAARFRRGMRAAVERGTFVYGECGGFMALGDALVDADGAAHAQLGVLPLVTSFADRRLHLGYRRARLRRDCPLGATGASFRGHEFHYATVVSSGPAPALFELADATAAPLGPAGLVVGRVAGSFVHLIDRETPA
jgi:cobyrinic acid a,c-diamide synthase